MVEIEAIDLDLMVLKYPTLRVVRKLTNPQRSESRIKKRRWTVVEKTARIRQLRKLGGNICGGTVVGEQIQKFGILHLAFHMRKLYCRSRVAEMELQREIWGI